MAKTPQFLEYLSAAQATSFDWDLTVQDVGVARALLILEDRIRIFNTQEKK